MAFSFRRRIKVLPGVRLNVSHKSISASVGKPGSTVTVGKKGVRGTVGVPGTGLSYSKERRWDKGSDGAKMPLVNGAEQKGRRRWVIWVALAALIFVGLLIVGAISTPDDPAKGNAVSGDAASGSSSANPK